MENKQLNFHQPFLSARNNERSFCRISSYAECPVKKPGAIPFLWEKTPGRPKDVTESHTHQDANEQQLLITAPKPPPGRISKVNRKSSGNGQIQSLSQGKKTNELRHYMEVDDDDDEDERDEDFGENAKYSAADCRLLPRLCLRNSFCALNPATGMSVRTVRALAITPTSSSPGKRSSSTGSSSETEEEEGNVIGLRNGELDEARTPLKDDDHKPSKNHCSFQELLANERRKMFEKTLYVDTIHKVKSPMESGFREDADKILAKADNRKPDMVEEEPSKDHKFKNQHEFPVIPPLPKCPSDSWLLRTLRNAPSSRAYSGLGTNRNNQTSKRL